MEKYPEEKPDKKSLHDSYEKFSKSYLSTNVQLNASMLVQRKKMFDQYNTYSKY